MQGLDLANEGSENTCCESDSTSSCQDGDDENLEIPFFAWECVSLQLKDGYDINLIIKDELTMQIFLQFLIFKLKSFDGLRDTFKKIYEASKLTKFSSEYEIMQRIYNRYMLMKVQMKISYEACR